MRDAVYFFGRSIRASRFNDAVRKIMKAREVWQMKQGNGGRKNCWEYKNCGRQPGGPRTEELGVCPVPTHEDLHGAHGGRNAGRACWVIAGSLCGGKIQGTFAQKLSNCWRCDFFNEVKKEEESTTHGFSATRLGLERVIERQKNGII